MGINNRVFELLATFCKKPALANTALVAGYPDFLVYPDVLTKYLGRSDFPRDPASDTIIKMHAEAGLDYSRDPKAVFEALGYSMEVIDIYRERGCEKVVDLNYPQTLGEYNLVVDHGTIEHCFNIGQAAINLASAVTAGGFIVQHLPFNMYNHGFYNMNPTWFYDFYETNGFQLFHLEGWCWKTKQFFTVPKYDGFSGLPDLCLLTMVARCNERKPITYPMQHKYAAAPKG